jgi:hypothetical protein
MRGLLDAQVLVPGRSRPYDLVAARLQKDIASRHLHIRALEEPTSRPDAVNLLAVKPHVLAAAQSLCAI